MKCVICQSDSIQTKEVREEIVVGSDIVYVPITVQVCGSCGERYYDRRTMRYLEDVSQQLSTGAKSLKEIGKVLLYD